MIELVLKTIIAANHQKPTSIQYKFLLHLQIKSEKLKLGRYYFSKESSGAFSFFLFLLPFELYREAKQTKHFRYRIASLLHKPFSLGRTVLTSIHKQPPRNKPPLVHTCTVFIFNHSSNNQQFLGTESRSLLFNLTKSTTTSSEKLFLSTSKSRNHSTFSYFTTVL